MVGWSSATPAASAVWADPAAIESASARRFAYDGIATAPTPLLLLVDCNPGGFVGVVPPVAGTSPFAAGHSPPWSSAGAAADGWNQRRGLGDLEDLFLELVEWGGRLRGRPLGDPLGRRAPAKIEHGREVLGRNDCPSPGCFEVSVVRAGV